ncbi:MAG TPA: lipoate--protein ligase family protein [Gemmataceae bacterium]|nr:lipoate--protein ligase family protein [Gemmataceae bacterium]
MSTTVCRLLPFAVADGPHNMAADEVLLEAAGAGAASLRFYGWAGPTVSLGYFQGHAVRRPHLPYVRRPSGGMMLVHHHEITYCLALPAGAAWQDGEPWLRRMHRIIGAGLARLGVATRLHQLPDAHRDTPLCFRHLSAGDLLIGAAKVAGSAQRKHRGALMQHGGLLLAQSPFAPELPGIRELTALHLGIEETTAAIRRAFVEQTRWQLVAAGWQDDEPRRIEELVVGKYASAAWNDRR